MLTYPEIDPVALSLGPLKIHWYGLMYVIGFLSFLWLGKRRAKHPTSPFDADKVDDLMFYGALGVVLGGRVGYMLFYNFSEFITAPWLLFQVWDGGMSFHGGLLGVILAMFWLARKWKLHFFQVSDFVAPMVPIGLGAGRIGNFINGELWGKPTEATWGMIFPHVDPLARHPSQLYQVALEGIALFLILWIFSNKPRPIGVISGLFLICYGIFRFIVEFFRVPDKQLGYLAWDWVTMGQILTIPMILAGAALIYWAYNHSQRLNINKK